TAAAKRFAELPLPSTSDEHWRFTDLRGFDPTGGHGSNGHVPNGHVPNGHVPNGHVPNGHVPGTVPGTGPKRPMLDLDVSGRAEETESGIEIVSAPAGIRFEPLPTDYDAKLIPDDDKFALENLARWQHGLLVHVPKGVELAKPLYVQVTSGGGPLFWRMVVIADEGARFTVIEDLS